MLRFVLDTDVVIAALRSQRGASAALLTLAIDSKIELLVTAALAFEYEEVAKRSEHGLASGMTETEVSLWVDSVIALCHPVETRFRWRPLVRDPDDEMVLDAAINGGAHILVTFNRRDYGDAPQRFGIKVMLPGEALERTR